MGANILTESLLSLIFFSFGLAGGLIFEFNNILTSRLKIKKFGQFLLDFINSGIFFSALFVFIVIVLNSKMHFYQIMFLALGFSTLKYGLARHLKRFLYKIKNKLNSLKFIKFLKEKIKL